MKVGIQILNFNGLKWLPGVMQSLIESELGEVIIYLVDNASTDHSVSWMRERYREVEIIELPENLGYASAYNRTMPRAFADGCDWVCLLNPDVIVEKGWLQVIRRWLTAKNVGVLGPVFADWSTEGPSDYMKARHPDVVAIMGDTGHQPRDVDWVEGSVMFVSRGCFESVGPLNAHYFMYWEEADYCRRARYAGWRVVMVPGSICRHFGGGLNVTDRSPPMKTTNHMYYRLTDPERGYGSNLLGMMRLALTYLWQAVGRHRSIGELFVVLGCILRTLASTPRGYRDWRETRSRLA